MTTIAQQLATDLSAVLGEHKRRKAAKAKPAPKATPAKATPRAKAAPVAAAPVLALGRAFAAKAGGKYTQAQNWEVVLAALPATADQLVEAIKLAGGTNARGFVTGRIRGGNLQAS